MLGRHGHAQHRERGLARQHAGQMSRSPRACDEAPEPAPACLLGVRGGEIGSAVGREHPGLPGYVEFLESLGRVLHDRPVRIAADDDADEWRHWWFPYPLSASRYQLSAISYPLLSAYIFRC